jgi:HAD superfamily hydrolase (TIGR01509 family)
MDLEVDDPELVIFDCDGVLVDSEIISASVLAAELAGLGVDLDAAFFRARLLGRSFPTVVEEIAEAFSVGLPPDFESRYRATLLTEFERSLRPTEGILRILDSLSVRSCVATSSSPARVARTLEVSNLGRYFGANVFTASEVPRGKPAPDLFLHAAERMGVLPRHCLVIEDSLVGVEAARAAGMGVVRYVGGSHLHGTDPAADGAGETACFDTWAKFEQKFSRILSRIVGNGQFGTW